METTYTLDNKTLQIIQDESPESPRTWDNLGTLLFSHRRMAFGDEKKARQLVGSNDSQDYLDFASRKDVIALAVYMYDHSGQRLRVAKDGRNPFIGNAQHAEWDSGLIGWVVVTKKDAAKQQGWSKLSAKRVAQIKKYLTGEIEILDQYVSGDVYGFKLSVDGEETDSCWGFFGSDPLTNGIIDHVSDEWKAVFEAKK